MYNPITRMIEIATEDGVDVLRMGIPVNIFVGEWEDQYGMDVPWFALEEMEREFKDGMRPDIAMVYWTQLDDWFQGQEIDG
jgi:hypothetical protein